MVKCNFCAKDYDIPKGLTFVMNDGSVKHLCSSKCRKNMALQRRKVRWAKGVDALKGKAAKMKKAKKAKKKKK